MSPNTFSATGATSTLMRFWKICHCSEKLAVSALACMIVSPLPVAAAVRSFRFSLPCCSAAMNCGAFLVPKSLADNSVAPAVSPVASMF